MYAIYNMIDRTYYGSKDTQIKVYKTKTNALKQLKRFMRNNTFCVVELIIMNGAYWTVDEKATGGCVPPYESCKEF